ncbi:non-hydrolyzing UDP-N-acetylglucosamine 2-epimerase [Sphingomonas glaciei]|uniref:UDP-N-acetylglucosamine 2-epimerase (non-hydrolyzing) n=1 Tax=Sphingomonas glaciei TaxID=2938948 RepID=A0ABY5MXE0_9SPHN|nr:UDP-N-acetylglucosamine 2-epimerase (non-hydrolyzing) [Sphingomonas glaciei]UUR08149.1 UDP-N-acetylglucosamine 2-epimerase (non-hydrolyzing) [Sphingomonas glaciei]
MSPTILLVVGTRPEAIKLAPVARALLAQDLAPHIVLTGQHSQLDPAAFGLASHPVTRLRCPSGGDPRVHAEAVANAIAPLLRASERPAMLIVQGDTSSALGGALAATAAGLPLAHVEAGLRSHDLALPWPEEGNRVAIDRLSHLLFAATADNAANLAAEGVTGGVHVTGNTAIDALFDVLLALPPRLDSHGLPRLLVTCHRRENWGAAFTPIGLALIDLAQIPWLRIEVVLHSNPSVAAAARLLLGGHPRIRLLSPMAHRSMVGAIRSAHILLSDSGGIQEEAPALGIPLLVLRSTTERPEGIASGNSQLVGNDRTQIVHHVRHLLEDGDAYAAMAVPAFPFGDGKAAPRIAALCGEWLASEKLTRQALIA